jgi:hypothetical protein
VVLGSGPGWTRSVSAAAIVWPVEIEKGIDWALVLAADPVTEGRRLQIGRSSIRRTLSGLRKLRRPEKEL